jgi:hypothetical protein
MSDYFSQLVERSMGSPGIARPRVPGFYEPQKPASNSTHAEERDFGMDDPAVGRGLFSEDLMPRSPERSPSPNSHITQAKPLPATSNAESLTSETAFPGFRESQRERGEAARRPGIDTRFFQASTEEEQFPAEEQGGTSAAKTSSPFAQSNIVAAETQKRREAEIHPFQKRSPGELAASTPNEEIQKTAASLSAPSYQAVRARGVVQNLRTDSELEATSTVFGLLGRGPTPVVPKLFARPEPDDLRAQPAEPTIHVTIGRVEVRATTVEAPKRREPAARPVTTLEDYLRKQRGGTGR